MCQGRGDGSPAQRAGWLQTAAEAPRRGPLPSCPTAGEEAGLLAPGGFTLALDSASSSATCPCGPKNPGLAAVESVRGQGDLGLGVCWQCVSSYHSSQGFTRVHRQPCTAPHVPGHSPETCQLGSPHTPQSPSPIAPSAGTLCGAALRGDMFRKLESLPVRQLSNSP